MINSSLFFEGDVIQNFSVVQERLCGKGHRSANVRILHLKFVLVIQNNNCVSDFRNVFVFLDGFKEIAVAKYQQI